MESAERIENKGSVKINYELLDRSADFLRAINHPLRQKMIELIDSEGKINVTKLYVTMRLEQSVASQHLSILRKAGFLLTHREGKFIYYSVNKTKIEQANELIVALNN